MSVIDLDAFRKKKFGQQLIPVVIKDLPVELSMDHNRSIQEFTNRWNSYSSQGKLNNLFSNDLRVASANYLESLSDIVEVERTLKVRIAVMPSDFINRTLEETENGRAALFKHGTILISTPLLATEEEARMFALLLKFYLNSKETR